jgi:hypothetical protein
MPILTPTNSNPPLFYPEKDYIIVKYLDLLKFVSLLSNRSLFFCRLDKLEDKFEGKTGKLNYEHRINQFKNLREVGFFNKKLTDEDIEKKVNEIYVYEEKFKSITLVNCWNKNEKESVALWKIYSNFDKGIMIKSKVSNIIKAFENSKFDIFLSEVRYIDYEKEIMPDGNIMYPFLHKQLAYTYESEVRLIHQLKGDSNWTYNWEKEAINEGINIKVDLTELIDQIVISPNSQDWFYKLIVDICKKFGLKTDVIKSTLNSYK